MNERLYIIPYRGYDVDVMQDPHRDFTWCGFPHVRFCGQRDFNIRNIEFSPKFCPSSTRDLYIAHFEI